MTSLLDEWLSIAEGSCINKKRTRGQMGTVEDEGSSPANGLWKSTRKRSDSRKYNMANAKKLSPNTKEIANKKSKNSPREEKGPKDKSKPKYNCIICKKDFWFRCNYKMHTINKCAKSSDGAEKIACLRRWHHWRDHIEPEEKSRKFLKMKVLELRLERIDVKLAEKSKPAKCDKSTVLVEPKKIGINNNLEELFIRIPRLKHVEVKDPLFLEETIGWESQPISNGDLTDLLEGDLPFENDEVMEEIVQEFLEDFSSIEELTHADKTNTLDAIPCVTNDIIMDETEEKQTQKYQAKKDFIKSQVLYLAKTAKESEGKYTLFEDNINFDNVHQIDRKYARRNLWVFACQSKLVESPSLTTMNNTLNFEKRIEYNFRLVLENSSNDKVPDCMQYIIETFENMMYQTWKNLDEQGIRFDGQCVSFIMQRNWKDDVIVVIYLSIDNSAIKKSLKKHFQEYAFDWNVVAVYFTSPHKECSLIFGNHDAMLEMVGHLKVIICPKTMSEINHKSIELLAETADTFLQLDPSIALIEVGCESGLISMFLSKRSKAVFGIGNKYEVTSAKLIRDRNGIKNVTFHSDAIFKVETLFEKEIKVYENVVAIVNLASDCSLSKTMIKYLRGMKNLRKIVVVTMLDDDSISTVLRFMNQSPDSEPSCFTPKGVATLDLNPLYPSAYCVIYMEH